MQGNWALLKQHLGDIKMIYKDQDEETRDFQTSQHHVG